MEGEGSCLLALITPDIVPACHPPLSWLGTVLACPLYSCGKIQRPRITRRKGTIGFTFSEQRLSM